MVEEGLHHQIDDSGSNNERAGDVRSGKFMYHIA